MSCIWDVEGLVARYHRQALAASEDVKKAVNTSLYGTIQGLAHHTTAAVKGNMSHCNGTANNDITKCDAINRAV